MSETSTIRKLLFTVTLKAKWIKNNPKDLEAPNGSCEGHYTDSNNKSYITITASDNIKIANQQKLTDILNIYAKEQNVTLNAMLVYIDEQSAGFFPA